MAEPSIPQQLLEAARQDMLAAIVLREVPELKDMVVGFHLQQAAEKAIKAVLSAAGVPFRRTHDIAELLDLLTDSGLPAPPNSDWLDELNPYAVQARYGIEITSALDRARGVEALTAVIAWAAERVATK